VFVCARAGGDVQMGEEDTEQSKRAHGGTFWVFGVRGVLGGGWVVCVCVGRMGGWRGTVIT